ncbi:Alpha/beta hydrolase family protein [Luteibacter sp. UNCMF331Sha3.1]|uniref:alpha/beta fold hydrolase n=1 Tax=Luteibacter sp. UNCMF331Sha3.1 TaxID=1502760 RepID=UPI0008CDE5E7|nr:alpha/beta hydrolase [Luteibacter sp. UNCMF331Sha3.1]SEM22952.1 Alpha/beta hydrolase family protein [Luteibacter sp. UNCMF331Sha3.1]
MKPPRRFGVRTVATLLGIRVAYRFGSRFAPVRTVAHAARVFQTPLPSSRERAEHAARSMTARRETVTVDGESVATYVWGDPSRQPYVLLAHGWSSMGLRWENWVPQLLAKGWAAVAFDQPAHGLSGGRLCTLPDFVRTVTVVGQHYGDAEGVVAHSLGGAAVTLALDDGWTAKRVVLIAAAADPKAATRRFARFVRLGEHLRPGLHEMLARRTGVPIDGLHIEHHAPRRTQPALIVHDEFDRDVPVEEAEQYAMHWPGSTLLKTRHLGHRRIVDDASVVAAAIAFLGGADSHA